MTNRLLAYAQLLRLPNVFSAVADVLLASCAVGLITQQPTTMVLFCLASACLYLAGMAWNDYFDRHEDAKTRPNRPIPSGRIRPVVAWWLGVVLAATGLLLQLAAVGFDYQRLPFLLGCGLAVLILLYDSFFKHNWLGPVAMGGCRFLNVLIPLSIVELQLPAYHLAGVVGLYIVGVTWFARTEETTSRRAMLITATVVMTLAIVGLGTLLPLHQDVNFPFFPYLLVAFCFFVGSKVVAAIREPSPKFVQVAIKRCVLGLILLDAVLATVYLGWPGFAIALLLLPAFLLGRWVYST
jgi:4-hydroxybenzoate polyprenyltransferase